MTEKAHGRAKLPLLIVLLCVLLAELVVGSPVVEPTIALEGRSGVITVSNISVGDVVQIWKGGANCTNNSIAQVYASRQATSTSVELVLCGSCTSAGVFDVCMLTSSSDDGSDYVYTLVDTVQYVPAGFSPSSMNLETSNENSSSEDFDFPSTAFFYVGVKNEVNGSFLPEFCISAEDCDSESGNESEELDVSGLISELRSSYFVVAKNGTQCPSLSSFSAWSPITVTALSSGSKRWMAVADNFTVRGGGSAGLDEEWSEGYYYTFVMPAVDAENTSDPNPIINATCSNGLSGVGCSSAGMLYLNASTTPTPPNATELSLVSGGTTLFYYPEYPDTTFRFSNTTSADSLYLMGRENLPKTRATPQKRMLSLAESVSSGNLICGDEPNTLPLFTTNSSGYAEVPIAATTPSGEAPLSAGAYLLCRKVLVRTAASTAATSTTWVRVSEMTVFLPIYYSLVSGNVLVMNVSTPVLLQQDLESSALLSGVYGSASCSGSPLDSSEAYWSAVSEKEIRIEVLAEKSEQLYLCGSIPYNQSFIALPSVGMKILSPSPLEFNSTFEACTSFDTHLTDASDTTVEVAVSMGPCCRSSPGSTPIPATGDVVAIGVPTAPGVLSFLIRDSVVEEADQLGEKLYMCYSNDQDSCVTVGQITASGSSCFSSPSPGSSGLSKNMLILIIVIAVVAVLLICATVALLWVCCRLRKRGRKAKGKSVEPALLVKVVGANGKAYETEEPLSPTVLDTVTENRGSVPQSAASNTAALVVPTPSGRRWSSDVPRGEAFRFPLAPAEKGSNIDNPLLSAREEGKESLPLERSLDTMDRQASTHDDARQEKTSVGEPPKDTVTGDKASDPAAHSSSSTGLEAEKKAFTTEHIGPLYQSSIRTFEVLEDTPSESEDVEMLRSVSSFRTSERSLRSASPGKREGSALTEATLLRSVTPYKSGEPNATEESTLQPFSSAMGENAVGVSPPLQMASAVTHMPSEAPLPQGEQSRTPELASAVTALIQREGETRYLLCREEDDTLRHQLESAYTEWRNSITAEGQILRNVLQRTALQTGQCQTLIDTNEHIFEEVVERVAKSTVVETNAEKPFVSGVEKEVEKTVVLPEVEPEKDAAFSVMKTEEQVSPEVGEEPDSRRSSVLPSALVVELALPPNEREESKSSESSLEEEEHHSEVSPRGGSTFPSSPAAAAAAVEISDPTNLFSARDAINVNGAPRPARKSIDFSNRTVLIPPSLDSDND